MLKQRFKKSTTPAFHFVSPLAGTLVPLTDIPDPVFSEKMLGDGLAIEPSDGRVYAPCNGTVATLFPTGHAIGLVADSGHELLIHFGMDTVTLDGQGFSAHVTQGEQVQAGQLLITVDMDTIRDQVPSLMTPVIFTNLDNQSLTLHKTGPVSVGDTDILTLG